MRTVELGVTITAAAVDGEVTVVFCDLLADGPGCCPQCGQPGAYRDTVIRKVTDVPVVGHAPRLWVRVPRNRCPTAECDWEVFAHNTFRLARPGWSTTRRCARYILRRLMLDPMTVSAVARELGLSGNTVNTIVREATQTIVAADALPEATTVMDPFHVVALAGAKLNLTRQRVQHDTLSHRARTGDPLYGVRRTLRTRLPLLSASQQSRLSTVFADERHIAVLVTWSIYQCIIAPYCHPDRRRGKTMLTTIIDSLRSRIPAGLEELAQLGRTLWRRRVDVLVYFDHHASNGPTEAINGRLEVLRRNALGFRNLTHYRIRSLLHCGNLTHQIDAR
jgi:transposase